MFIACFVHACHFKISLTSNGVISWLSPFLHSFTFVFKMSKNYLFLSIKGTQANIHTPALNKVDFGNVFNYILHSMNYIKIT